MSLRKQTPSEFLKQIIGKPVVVKLNSGVDYRGRWYADIKFIVKHASVLYLEYSCMQVCWPVWMVI